MNNFCEGYLYVNLACVVMLKSVVGHLPFVDIGAVL